MANSTTNLDTLSSSQASKEVTANELFDAGSPATAFGRRASTSSGLTWGFYGGTVLVDGVITQIANGTVALTASATNFVERTRAGVVSANTSAFTPGRIPLYTAVTGASTVTSYTDHRSTEVPSPAGLLSVAVTTANVTLTDPQSRNRIITVTGTLTGNRDLIVPTVVAWYIVHNNTAGAFTLTVKTASGTGIAVTQGQKAILYCDGTNVLRATADV